MKKIIIKITQFTFIALALVACDSVDFGDINDNPNASSTAASAGLLASAMRSIGDYTASTTPNLYSQYLSNGQYPDEGRYVTEQWSYYGWYAGPLRDLKEVVTIQSESSDPKAPNTLAIATLTRAYMLHNMTDRWGYIPYSEALMGVDNVTPAFDSQEAIYTGLFNEIDTALNMINNAGSPEGDIMFGGDMDRWKQFGNTLKVVMALRLSKRNADIGGLAKTKFNEAIGGAISTSDENIYYTFLSDDNNDNPWQDRFVDAGRVDWLMSDVIVNFMIGNGTDTAPEDPRLAKYANPVTDQTYYLGADYGSGNDIVTDYSFINESIITSSTRPGYIFTAAQIQFSMAEAVELGWMSGTAEDYFDAGIQESMTQWGVDATDASTFIAGTTYNGIQSIAEQKWVALFLQGYESWAEWRRIGGPDTIVPPEIMLNGTGIPQRQGYPSTASSTNETNYNAAVSAQGTDNLDTKLWWAN